MTHWLNRCHFGDVRAVLRRMIAEGVKVNTIVTSPPYWGLRDYGHDGQLGREDTLAEFLATMVEVFNLAREVLADDGTAWVNMGDCYISRGGAVNADPGAGQKTGARAPGIEQANRTAQDGLKSKDMAGQPWRLAFALQDAGWWLRSDIIWHKPNPMPESVRDRPTKSHEYLFLFSKSERYFFDMEAWKEPVSGGAKPRRASNGVGFGHGFDAKAKPRQVRSPSGWASDTDRRHDEPLGRFTQHRKLAAADSRTKNNVSMDAALTEMREERNRRSVWTIPTEAFHGAHFATYPQKLVEPCVLAGCPADGTVLDIFFGSGTTGQVAQRLGRNWIGIELNPANEALQRERIGQQTAFPLEVA